MATENKDFEYYAGRPYETVIVRDEDGWFAKVPDLPGCMTWTDTFEDLGPMIEDAKRSWIGEALEHGDPVPEPRTTEGYSGKVNLRMPKSLHRDLARRAQSEGVSLNQLMISYLARGIGPEMEMGASYINHTGRVVSAGQVVEQVRGSAGEAIGQAVEVAASQEEITKEEQTR